MESNLLQDLADLRLCGWSALTTEGRAQWDSLQLRARQHPANGVHLSSCQRVEIYHAGTCHCDADISLAGRAALDHLAEVAAGLHSVVLGEREILGQVRAASAGAPPSLAPLVASAISAARELRRDEALEANTGHLLDRALRLAGISAQGRVAVVGAGVTARAVVARAAALGFKEIVVASRTEPDGEWFAVARCHHVPFDHMRDVSADVVVTAVGSNAAPLPEAALPRAGRLLVDLGTPRNTAGPFAVPLIDIAGLWNSEFGRGHGDARRARLRLRLAAILDRRLAMLGDDHSSAVGSVRANVERVRRLEVERTLRLHPELPPSAVETITRSLVNQIFHLPSQRLRSSADAALAHQFAALFAPSEEGEPAL